MLLENRGGTDRNQLIGFLIIGAILVGASFWTQSMNQAPEETAVVDAAAPADQPTTPTAAAVVASDTAFAPAEVSLQNEHVTLTWTTAGAQLKRAELRTYKNWQKNPLLLLDDNHALYLADGKQVETRTWPFAVESQTDSSVVLSGSKDGKTLRLTYILPKTGYALKWRAEGTGWANGTTQWRWEQQSLRHEKSLSTEAMATTVYGWDAAEADDVSLSDGSDDDDSFTSLAWLGYKQQFFSNLLTRDGNWSAVEVESTTPLETDTVHTRNFVSSLTETVQEGRVNSAGAWYLGPNKYHDLVAFDRHFDVIIPFGWGIFGWISRYVVVPIFDWLDSYGLNYGLIILLMSLIIKLALSPLTFSSYKSMAKMRVLKPEIDEINEKHKDGDAMQKQQALMALYNKAGVNPLGGCIPQLLQFPILIAMFRFFPASIELRQESFLWADDLSSYDSIFTLPFTVPFYGDHVSLFTILMAISTFLYTKMNNSMTPNTGNDMMRQQMMIIQYVMPFMLLFFFNSYSAGLSYYYFVANMITFGQQYSMRFFINESAIRAKIENNKAKGGKKGGFQAKLQNMMEEQQNGGNRRIRRNNK
jgi:YidC/Oxa1 family membrane protein insertase